MKSKNNIKVLAVVVLCLFFSLAVEVQAGSITGRVFDSSNNPVPNLRVDVCAAVKKDNGDIDWKTSSLVKTQIDGSYTWPNLAPGEYKVRYSAQTVPELGLATEWYNDQTDFDAATKVTVGDGAVLLDDAILSGSGSISGTVTDETSEDPVKGVSVYVYDSSGSWRSTLTDDYGKYKIANLSTGNYTVQFFGGDTGYISEWYANADKESADSVPVNAPEETKDINASLSYGGSISGRVSIRETDASLAGAWVNVCDSTTETVCNNSNPAWKGYAITGTDGSYTIGGLPFSGTYKVQFFERMINNAGAGISKWYDGKSDAAAAVSVAVGKTDVNLAFDGASISGKVTDSAGEKIAGVIVKAYDSSGSLAATSPATGTDGAYTVVGLQRDSYTLYFQADGTGYSSEWYNNQTEEKSADAVDITSLGDALTGKDAELDLGVSISGTVTIKDGDSDPVPLEGGLVAVYDSADSSLLRGTATTGTDGIYEVTGLPAGGTFKVRFFRKTTANGSGYGTSEWYDDQPNFDQATEVQAGDTTVDAVLEPSSLIPIYKLLLKSRPQPENP